MKTNANCGATSAVGSWSEPMPGSGSFAACWCVMSICSPTTAPSSTSLAFGLLSGGIFETRSRKRFKFLTNNFTLPALTIAQLYKSRWQIELFFRWIKQHLRIKAFYGTSENAVKTQIWIAVSVYVLVAIVRKRLGLEASLYQILQILSVTLFEKTPILQALQTHESQFDLPDYANQFNLFDL